MQIINPIPLVIDRKASMAPLGINGTADPTSTDKLTIASDGVNVEFTNGIIAIDHTAFFIPTDVPLLAVADLMQEENVYVSITLLQNGKVNVFICTEDMTIYDGNHELSGR